MMFASCSKSCGGVEPKPISRSVLIYIASQNSLVGFDQLDVAEILLGAKNIGADNRVILFLDDYNKPRLYEINQRTDVKRLEDLKPIYTFERDVDSASPEVFEEVLSMFFTRYAAKDYGLVMWSHASGWINSDSKVKPVSNGPNRSFAEDKGQIDASGRTSSMDIPDMAKVFAKFPKFEYILFDACFMQTIEVDYELRDAAKYIIASPAEIPGDGAPYNKIMSALTQSPFSPKVLIDAYAGYYHQYTAGVLLSAVKTDEFDGFLETVSPILSKYVFSEHDFSNSQNYYYLIWNDMKVGGPFSDFYDMQGIMMKALSEDDFKTWKTALGKLVPYASYCSWWETAFQLPYLPVDKDQYCGVSMFVPLEKYKKYTFYDYYFQTQWGKNLFIK